VKAVTGLGDSKLPHETGDRLKNAGFQKRNGLDRLRMFWVLLLGIINVPEDCLGNVFRSEYLPSIGDRAFRSQGSLKLVEPTYM
jgi:hypothetical protein